jgi:hypothetical protein
MTLTTLRPAFLRTSPDGSWGIIDSFTDAQGISFDCPCCGKKHRIVCWFDDRGTPSAIAADRGRWVASGSGLADLTLSPSIHLLGGCAWQGSVTNGEVTSA